MNGTDGHLPMLLAVSDRRRLPGHDLLAWCEALRAAGVDGVQLREKDLEDRALFEAARQVRGILPPGSKLLVNGRADVAVAAGADGVHLPADGVPVAPLRRRFGGLLLGRSTHHLEEVEDARRSGADYVTFGPVYPTPGKGPPTGLAALAAAAGIGIPVFALGGVEPDRFPEVAAAGAHGAAGIRMFVAPAAAAVAVVAAREAFRR